MLSHKSALWPRCLSSFYLHASCYLVSSYRPRVVKMWNYRWTEAEAALGLGLLMIWNHERFNNSGIKTNKETRNVLLLLGWTHVLGCFQEFSLGKGLSCFNTTLRPPVHKARPVTVFPVWCRVLMSTPSPSNTFKMSMSPKCGANPCSLPPTSGGK